MPERPSDKCSYKLAKALGNSHSDTINFLSFSPCGRFLASGGDDNYMCVYDCSDPRRCEVALRIKANSQPSAICWNTSLPISVFVGYGNGGVVKHSICYEEGRWLPGVLLQNGSDRVVSLAWDRILAVATQSAVYIVDQDASKLKMPVSFSFLNPAQGMRQTGSLSQSQLTAWQPPGVNQNLALSASPLTDHCL